MLTEMQSKIITKIILFFIINGVLLTILYNIPINNNPILENLCLYKLFTSKECWNCGMTRAFLSILHGNFEMALIYNKNSIIIFLFTTILYLYSWHKYIFKKN